MTGFRRGLVNDTPTSQQPERLGSWKAIAAYVKRDVTTVQRWEKREAMPVHRHQHDKRGSVYAFRAELDAWMASRGAQLPPDGPSRMSPRMYVFGGLALLLLCLAAWWLWHSTEEG